MLEEIGRKKGIKIRNENQAAFVFNPLKWKKPKFNIFRRARSDGIGDVNLNILQLLISAKLVEFRAYFV